MLAIAISTVNAFAGEEKVNQKVLEAFKTEFSTATDVQWSVGANYYMATFNYNEKYVFAYFSEDGELLGITRCAPSMCRFILRSHPLLALRQGTYKHEGRSKHKYLGCKAYQFQSNGSFETELNNIVGILQW